MVRPTPEPNTLSVTETQCRSCRQGGLIPILSLGQTPLANALRTAEELNDPEPRWPLELVRCTHCSLVQITETVSPQALFSDYAYFSSFSDTMVAHARSIAEQTIEREDLNDQSLAVEVASNDGYLLQWYAAAGIPVLGIEPAENIASFAQRERGVDTLCEFFGSDVAQKLRDQGRRASVIHANNVLAHVPDLNGVVQGFKTLLDKDGVVIVEAPYLGDFIDNLEFDTVYHEHLCYFSLQALDHVFQRHGLTIHDVEELAIHGGSLRIYASHTGQRESSPAVESLRQRESKWVNNAVRYRQFADRVQALRGQLLQTLQQLKAEGKRIVVYGASAKGSTLMNYFGIDQSLVEYVVDRSTVKQGRFTPGNQLKIYDPSRLVNDRPDYCLLLTWNFADEIMRQQQAYRDGGGKFIVPLPEPKVA